MAQFPAIPLWTDAYLGDTNHLTATEHGTYFLLLMAMWRSGEARLPSDDKMLARFGRVTTTQWQRMKPIIMPFFSEVDGFITQSRLTDEWAAVRRKAKQASDSANAKWLKHKKGRHADASASQCERNATITITTTTKDIEGEKQKSGKSRKQPEVPLPDDWKPNLNSVQKAQALGFNPREIGREAEKFKNHARQKDRRVVRWDAAFDNWIINSAEFQNKAPPEAKSTGGFSALPGSPEFQAWRTYLRDNGKGALVRQLEQRELEGRAFNFESRWPPGHKSEAA